MVHDPHGVGLKRRQSGQVNGKGAGPEIDGCFARHEDEGTRQSLDVPELDPHDVGAVARHLSRSKGQIFGQEHVRNPDAVVSVNFLRSRAGRDCEDERAQQDRDCSSGVHEPAGSHDSSPGSSPSRTFMGQTNRPSCRPTSLALRSGRANAVPPSSSVVTSRKLTPRALAGTTVKRLVKLSGQHLPIRTITRRLDISRNTARKCCPARRRVVRDIDELGGHPGFRRSDDYGRRAERAQQVVAVVQHHPGRVDRRR